MHSVLLGKPDVPDHFLRQVTEDYRTFADSGLPPDWTDDIRQRYAIDLSSEYAGIPIRNPFGKASGQLSMTRGQVEDDIRSGLGFVVLKTLIAEDQTGVQAMSPWSVREAKMLVEPITGQRGDVGWTVSWKGRGWWRSFDDYLELVAESTRLARGTGIPIVPSVKYHLPADESEEWRVAEYRHTTPRLLDAWREGCDTSDPMPLEKDFSPTLAGSEKSRDQTRILNWLQDVPRLIHDSVPANAVRVGLKLMNTLYEDDFQRQMVREINRPESRADFFIYGNRLFDPDRTFEGHRGIAYGGPDLSDRNLWVMSTLPERPRLSWSATGNITSGRMALEYALCGASSFQMHTVFQLPGTEYAMQRGSRTERTLHELIYHPTHGLLVWMKHIAIRCGVDGGPIKLTDLVGRRDRMVDQSA